MNGIQLLRNWTLPLRRNSTIFIERADKARQRDWIYQAVKKQVLDDLVKKMRGTEPMTWKGLFFSEEFENLFPFSQLFNTNFKAKSRILYADFLLKKEWNPLLIK